MSGKLCPRYFDTDDLFNSYYNEDTSTKCGPAYEFCQGGKLEFGQCRNNTATVDMDEFEIQRRIQDYSQFGLDAATGGNFSNIRAGVNKQVEDINYGKCTPKTANNLSTYKNVANPPKGGFINPASFRSFGHAELAQTENSNQRRRKHGHKRENFGAYNDDRVYPNDSAYSSTPAADHVPSSSTASDNGLIPAASEDIDNYDSYESIKNALSDVKDGFLSTITFGNVKKEAMGNESVVCQTCGNVLGILTILLVVFVVLYAFYCGYCFCCSNCCNECCDISIPVYGGATKKSTNISFNVNRLNTNKPKSSFSFNNRRNNEIF